jgi:hypothetical protein
MSLNKNEITSLLRRLYRVDELVDKFLNYIKGGGIMNAKNPLDFLIYARYTVTMQMYYLYFDHLEQGKEEWELTKNMLMEYITSEHGERIKNYYKNHVQKKNQL